MADPRANSKYFQMQSRRFMLDSMGKMSLPRMTERSPKVVKGAKVLPNAFKGSPTAKKFLVDHDRFKVNCGMNDSMDEPQKHEIKKMYDYNSCRDIKGAYPSLGKNSPMRNSLAKQKEPKTNFADTVPDWHGTVRLDDGRKILDTKRFMRSNDIDGAVPKH